MVWVERGSLRGGVYLGWDLLIDIFLGFSLRYG